MRKHYEVRLFDTATIAVVDVETTGLNMFGSDKIFGLAIYLPEKDQYHWIRTDNAEWLTIADDMKSSWNAFVKAGGKLINWNTRFDVKFLHLDLGWDIPTYGNIVDVALHYRELVSNAPNFKLKDVARRMKIPTLGEDEMKQWGKDNKVNVKTQMVQVPDELVKKYALDDVRITWEIYNRVQSGLDKWQVRGAAERRDKLNTTLLEMELNGFHTDKKMLDILESRFDVEAEKEKIAEYVRQNVDDIRYKVDSFNSESPSQVLDVFRQLGFDINSTGVDVLEEIDHPLAQMILNYRSQVKAVKTYYRPYQRIIESNNTRRIHPTFFGFTATGRLSCGDPNIQNIPRKTKGGWENDPQPVKKVFTAPPGYVMIQCDFSQLELRLAAHFAKQQLLLDEFTAGRDVHQTTANQLSEIIGIPVSRMIAKTANFGFLYGAMAKRARSILGLPNDDHGQELASTILNGWNELYPEFKRYREFLTSTIDLYGSNDIILEPLDTSPHLGGKYVRYGDRVRRFDNIAHHTKDAMNSTIQGMGAILMETSMCRMAETWDWNKNSVQLIGTIHDSAIAYARADIGMQVAKWLKDCMTFNEFRCPIVSEVEMGECWYDLEEVKLDD